MIIWITDFCFGRCHEFRFDHQMVVHNEGRRIYVFGGKHENEPNSNGNGSTTNGNESVYSGLYSYDIVTRKWHNFLYVFSPISSPNHFDLLIKFDNDVVEIQLSEIIL